MPCRQGPCNAGVHMWSSQMNGTCAIPPERCRLQAGVLPAAGAVGVLLQEVAGQLLDVAGADAQWRHLMCSAAVRLESVSLG